VENVPRDPIPSRIDPFTRSSPCGHPASARLTPPPTTIAAAERPRFETSGRRWRPWRPTAPAMAGQIASARSL